MARKNSTPAPSLPVQDRAYNAGLEHGAQIGAHAKVAARVSVEHLKRGSAVSTNYGHGFLRGFAAGWKAV